MYFKRIACLVPLLAVFNKNPNIARLLNVPLEINGYVLQTELYQDMPLKFSINKMHPYAYLYVKIYKDDVLVVNTDVTTVDLKDVTFYIPAFTQYGRSANIKMVTNYYENQEVDTTLNFTVYSQHKKFNIGGNADSITYTDYFATRVNFYAKTNTQSITYDKETVTFNGINNIDLTNTRYLDLSNISVKIDSLKEAYIDQCELHIYCKFENSDIYYSGSYSVLYVDVVKTNYNEFYLTNDFKYYMNENTGMINESCDDDCISEAIPLYIPLSCGYNKKISYALIFDNVGFNLNKYTINSSITLGENYFDPNTDSASLKFHYESLENYIMGARYE